MKKRKLIIAALAVLLLGGGLGTFLYLNHQNYARAEDVRVPTDATALDLRSSGLTDVADLQRCTALKTLDLRGNPLSAEQVEALQTALPDCDILWSVPLDGRYYDCQITELTLRDLTAEDWDNVLLFPGLGSLTVKECTRFDRLDHLRSELPECEIHSNVPLAGKWYSDEIPQLEIDAQVSVQELREALNHFPELLSVRVGTPCSREEQLALQNDFPDVRFLWDVQLGGQSFSNALSSLRFTSADGVTVDELRTALPLFPYLRELDLRECAFSLEELNALAAEFPGLKVLWQHELLGRVYPSDVEEIDLSRIPMTDTAEVENALCWFPQLKKVIMSDCGFTDEQMDALNNRHEDVRFVWTVYFGPFSMRTDETQFIAARFKPWAILYDSQIGCFRYCTDLIALDLGHMQITDLSFLKYMPHMKYLIMAENQVADLTPLTWCSELSFVELFKNPITDLSPLLDCPSLRDLNICYISAKPFDAYDVLAQMTWLDRLWYCGTWFTEQMKLELEETLPNCDMDLRWGAESTGGAWRKHPHYYAMRDAFHMYYMPGGTNGVDENGNAIIYFG